MSEDQADTEQESDQTNLKNVLIERSPIIVGVVGAVMALITLASPPVEFFIVAHAALAWLSMALAVLAMVSIARGQQNLRYIVSLVVGLGGFVFWSMAPETIGVLPQYAYILTAVVYLGVGILIGRMDLVRQRSVYIACAGAVVFTIVTAAPKLGM